MPDFLHLHCHTQYSLLDGASRIETMLDKAVADGHKGAAITDHGNMYGAFKFVNEAKKRNLKPIVGCEFYLVEDRHKRSFSRKHRRPIDEADLVSEWILDVERPLAPRAYRDLPSRVSVDVVFGEGSAGTLTPLVGRLDIVHREVEPFRIGLRVVAVPVGAGVEARQDRSPAQGPFRRSYRKGPGPRPCPF